VTAARRRLSGSTARASGGVLRGVAWLPVGVVPAPARTREGPPGLAATPVKGGMPAALRPYRHRVAKIPKWLPSLHDPDPPRLWRIGYALAACFAVAVAGLAALWLAAQALLGHPHLVISKGITVHDTVGVAQLVFASVAGAGALVALVVAYRRQRVSEVATVEDKDRWEATAAHDRTRVFNERFTAIATQFGDDQPAVRLAGVHAMAGLADDWEENRQTCVDVLCAYLRLPYDPDPGDDAEPKKLAAYRANREVRHTIIRLIGDHLRPDVDPGKSWQGLNLDFTSVVFDGGDFTLAAFSGGTVRFGGAAFSGGRSASRAPSSAAVGSSSVAPRSPAARSASAPSSAAARSVSRAPRSAAAGSSSATPGSPAARSASVAPSSPAARSTSTAPSSPAARSASAAPRSPAARSASTAPGSPAARSASAPSFPAARSASAAPSSAAARSGSAAPSSPVARRTSVILGRGPSRRNSIGGTAHHQRG